MSIGYVFGRRAWRGGRCRLTKSEYPVSSAYGDAMRRFSGDVSIRSSFRIERMPRSKSTDVGEKIPVKTRDHDLLRDVISH